MGNPSPSPASRFKPEGKRALSRKVIGIKVEMEIEKFISNLPADDRSKWLREIVTQAAKVRMKERSVDFPD